MTSPTVSRAIVATGYASDGRSVAPVGSLADAFNLPSRNGPSSHAAVLHQDQATVYRIDQIDGRWVVSILDRQGALLRRIPAHAIVQMARRLERVMSEGRLGLDARA